MDAGFLNFSGLRTAELPVFYIRCLFISMPLIREIFVPEGLLRNTLGLEFSVQSSYSSTPPL
jgi:hypothetical protein